MSYLVLARKWRPRSFDTLVGQDHVVRALRNALSSGRLHHAWLFTGTRGVGKTTLSRILAKSLNCEQGITDTPCGHCRACTEIDAGRFVDYVELDAASNRGVDEMTQLLEQAVYAPSVGRFKVYMIDEVHMLTGHAFNAMLKTLEEPPPHVKFILATTDPQKIPVTVLSRCLQFNLKQMTVPAIVAHLQHVLGAESIEAEEPALRLIAQAAAGSMRDALSLTDQAISYAAGPLTAAQVGEMLGTLDQHQLLALLRALVQADAAGVLAVADALQARGLSYRTALGDLAVLLSQLAIAQRVGHVADDHPLAAHLQVLAPLLSADEIQLFYTVAVHSRQELTLAPDEHAGFIMACLRMLSLLPADREPPAWPDSVPGAVPAAPAEAAPQAPVAAPAAAPHASAAPEAAVPAPALVADEAPAPEAPKPEVATPEAPAPEALAPEAPASEAPVPASEPTPVESAADDTTPDDAAWEAAPQEDEDEEARIAAEMADAASDDPDDGPPPGVQMDDLPEALAAALAAPEHEPAPEVPAQAALEFMDAARWPALAQALPLTGSARSLAMNSVWLGASERRVRLRVGVHSLTGNGSRSRLQTVLSEHFGCVVHLEIEHGATDGQTASAHNEAERAQRQLAAEQAVADDTRVQALAQRFGARVVPGSIHPSAPA